MSQTVDDTKGQMDMFNDIMTLERYKEFSAFYHSCIGRLESVTCRLMIDLSVARDEAIEKIRELSIDADLPIKKKILPSKSDPKINERKKLREILALAKVGLPAICNQSILRDFKILNSRGMYKAIASNELPVYQEYGVGGKRKLFKKKDVLSWFKKRWSL